MKEIKIVTKISVYLLDECSESEKKLINMAKESCNRAYAPYSKFNVGAAVMLDNGEIFVGNNQENAAFPSGLCAERVALMYANASYPDEKVVAIAIAANTNGNFTKDVITPCGACRQVLLEAENRYKNPIRVLMSGRGSVTIIDCVKDLLPLSFGEKSLRIV